MINDTNQNQSGGDGSTNLQATNIYIGISASEARQIALDVYNANITTLSREAALTARSRAEELTDDFLRKVVEQRPTLLAKFSDPGIQIALLNAQKEYARTGDKDLENLLVNLLLDRASEPTRNLRQIALEEAMTVLPKLTQKQVNILTLNLLINENWSRTNSIGALKWFLTQAVKFKTKIEFQSPDILHLEFTGCAKSLNSASYQKGLVYHLTQYHSGLFAKGFSMEEFAAQVGENPDYSKWLIPCPRTPNKFMMNAVSFHELEGIGDYSQEERIKLSQAFKMNLMNSKEVQEFLIELEPEFEFFFAPENSSICQLALTPVGVAIACANFTKTTGQFLSWPYSMRNV